MTTPYQTRTIPSTAYTIEAAPTSSAHWVRDPVWRKYLATEDWKIITTEDWKLIIAIDSSNTIYSVRPTI